jgi:hypothetical protein
MRKPDAETYELGHWESMTIQRALTDLAESNDPFLDAGHREGIKELAGIFALGTHTVTRKIGEDQ